MKLLTPLHITMLLIVVAACGAAPTTSPAPPAELPELFEYKTKYYTIYTDLEAADVREATLRMTLMVEEYTKRTAGFSGAITEPMPFFLYAKYEDYLATGAPKGTAGYFSDGELVAFAGVPGRRTWNTVQHEGFHEFAHFVIRGDLPMWVSEGLADYFGEAVFTGEGFISGVIPQFRLARLQRNLREGKFKPFDEMMNLTRKEWNQDISVETYDQAWSMVHFLAHGENEKYQKAFGTLMVRIGAGDDPDRAWSELFGNTKTFEDKWRAYWLGLPENPTLDRYIQANLTILTGFFGRAVSQRQQFKTFEAFRAAAESQALKAHPDDWLPPSLLESALAQAKSLATSGYTYSLNPARSPPQLLITQPDGRRVLGQFTIKDGRVNSVKVQPLPATTR